MNEFKITFKRKVEARRAIRDEERREEGQIRDMISEGCPNAYFVSDMTDAELYRSRGMHAGSMSPVNGIFEMQVAEGYFNKGYIDLVREYEAMSKQAGGEWLVINRWFSRRLNAFVAIGEHETTKKRKCFIRKRTEMTLNFMFGTPLIAPQIWKDEYEIKAMSKLRTHLRPFQYTSYLTTGQFTEQSKRSHIHYIFRRCRPTLAMKFVPEVGWSLLAGLCFHPVGYYQNSWCGGLVPSDDIIAHLLFMRTDEHGFWKKATQHPSHAPQLNL